ncbi:YdcF family protein [Ancylothrix sp. C2]|uniref:YdcF family protein n=1 Tax=Ancylothrix sp. D3o TaxID=2953691 RepID=UPI0021BA9560|nr:YdcF family protein [Ancylothrix sp. D3o]MCT7950891.1 YdcF family protein [Ancylothrix sp. D3o]
MASLLNNSKLRRFLVYGLLIFFVAGALITGQWLLKVHSVLQKSASEPVSAILVLGGSIQREIYAAELAKTNPKIPILISQGSADPCIWLLFQRAGAPLDQVLLEKCAHSTFDNFKFSLPILQSWQVKKVKVITSPSHLPRAQWLAQIMLGSHGIWVDIELAQQKGMPGNREFWLKTSLDLIRATVWVFLSQFNLPECSNVIPLSSVDIQTWHPDSFKCEKYIF